MPAHKVIVTRPEPDASRFADDLRAAGFEPVLSPAMEIVRREERPDLSGVGALAFTSANGVRAFSGMLSGSRALPVFAVGAMTAAEAKAAGFSNVTAAGGDVASLAGVIAGARGAFAGSVLHISGADQAGDLAGLLQARGMSASRAVLYEANMLAALSAPAEAALTRAPYARWVALFSPRSAAIFLAQAARAKAALEEAGAACLSEAVADAVSVRRWRTIAVAKERSSASLIRLMEGGG